MKNIAHYPEAKDFIANAPHVGNDLFVIDSFTVPDYMFKPFQTQYFTAVLFLEGEYDISINMRRYHIEAPSMLFFLQYTNVQYHSTTRQPKAIAIVLSPYAVKRLLHDRGDSVKIYQTILDTPVIPLTPEDKARADLFMMSLHEVLKLADNPYQLEIVQHLSAAFLLSMSHLKKTPLPAQNHKEELHFNFLNLLKKYCRTERSVAFYANSLCLSPKHLSKVVKEVSGRTVHEWIEDYVCTEAGILLRSTDMTVSQVAEAFGFASQSLFSRFFRRTTGVNPSDVRRTMVGR